MKISFPALSSLLTAYGLLTACEDKNELSRSKAERMLTEQFKFPVTDTIRIHNMHQIDEYAVGPYHYLEKKGLVKLAGKTIQQYGRNQTVYTAALTDAGRKYLFAERKNPHSQRPEWLLEGHKTELREITGIQFNESGVKMAKVDFKVVTKDFTPFDVFAAGGEEQYVTPREGKTQDKDVVFQLYDDGWRIKSERW